MKTGVALACAILLAAPATAQSPCADRDRIIAKLQNRYGETRQILGLSANNSLIEVFASEKTGTWTITVTMPGGMTCLVASGQSYEELNEAVELGDEL